MFCQGTNDQGQPCGGYAVKGSQFCFFHDPALAQERAEASRRGGERSRARHWDFSDGIPTGPRTLDDVLLLLDIAAADALVLENSVQRGRLLVALAGAYSEVIQASDLERRVETIEAIVTGREPRP